MQYRIEHYTPLSIDDAVLVERTAHSNRLLLEELPDDPPLIPEDSIKRMRSLPPNLRVHFWLLWYQNRIAGQAYLDWEELESNKHLAFVDVTLEPELRQRGIGSEMLALAVDRALGSGKSIMRAESTARLPAGRFFLEALGFRPGLAAHINQLDLKLLDRGQMERWLAVGQDQAGDYRIETWRGPVPDPELVEFARVVNVMNSEPRGDLDVEDTLSTPEMIRDEEAFLFANGSRRLISVARHLPSAALVGFTALSWNPKRAAVVWQHGTGVDDSHRNRGLGRWLKAANMVALLSANAAARFVRTGNADSNAPMLAINRRMGFAPLTAEIAWQGEALKLAAVLRQRQSSRAA